jgi:hypothetical protein
VQTTVQGTISSLRIAMGDVVKSKMLAALLVAAHVMNLCVLVGTFEVRRPATRRSCHGRANAASRHRVCFYVVFVVVCMYVLWSVCVCARACACCVLCVCACVHVCMCACVRVFACACRVLCLCACVCVRQWWEFAGSSTRSRIDIMRWIVLGIFTAQTVTKVPHPHRAPSRARLAAGLWRVLRIPVIADPVLSFFLSYRCDTQFVFLAKSYFFTWWNVFDFAVLCVAFPLAVVNGNSAVSRRCVALPVGSSAYRCHGGAGCPCVPCATVRAEAVRSVQGAASDVPGASRSCTAACRRGRSIPARNTAHAHRSPHTTDAQQTLAQHTKSRLLRAHFAVRAVSAAAFCSYTTATPSSSRRSAPRTARARTPHRL